MRKPVARGLGRGAKNLAALMKRSASSTPPAVPAAKTECTPVAATTTTDQNPDQGTGGSTSGSNPNSNATDKIAAESKGNEPSSEKGEEKPETPVQGDNATTDASTAAERRTQTQVIVPARRGKGFGIKNLRAMKDRSIQKTSDPDSSNNDTEAGDNNDESKKDGKESDN